MLLRYCFLSVILILSITLPVLSMPAEVSSTGHLKLKARGFEYIKRFFDIVPVEKGQKVPASVTFQTGISEIQTIGGLEPTGELDEPTIRLLSRDRCGVPDKVVVSLNTSSGPDREKRYNVAGHNFKWQKTDLTYRVENYPDPTISVATREQVDETISSAFKVWSRVTPLTFTKVSEGIPADVILLFGKYVHTDVNGDPPFDGPGGVLGHAFTPNSGWGNVNGDVHFDDSEEYTVGEYYGKDLFHTAAHEIGHALGLDHSNTPGALMWPFAKGYDPNFRLPQDDIQGVQLLYGPNPNPEPELPFVTEAPPSIPESIDYCNVVFDDVAVIRGELYAFYLKRFWRFSTDGHLASKEKGARITDFFNSGPNKVSSVFERWYDGKIIFVRGQDIYNFDGTSLNPNYPRRIKGMGLKKGINAAMHRASQFTSYYFKGLRVYEYDEESQALKKKRPRRAANVFPGLPRDAKVTAAFTNYDGVSYLIVGKEYYKLEQDLSIKSTPKNFASDFLGCSETR